ncbi:MAG: roadblock/LC7 domain-containing protein [Planctomycetes bacterium]|nr:roadblock/LC7 domain-containing protein [Planctomycetota bacterium]
MNFLTRLLFSGRVRRARRALAAEPTPRNYLLLAQLYSQADRALDAQRVCVEGLAAFPENIQLSRYHQRTKRAEREVRLGELRRELALAPRAQLWRELCEILIESDELARAEEELSRWLARDQNPEARYLIARVALARFYADRGRTQGRAALTALDEAIQHLPRDLRPLRAKLDFMCRLGAWQEARDCAALCLTVEPGTLELEGRYRTLSARCEGAPNFERALHEVERSGRLSGDGSGEEARASAGSVQSLLRELAAQPDVQAVLYVRGATALVQGPKGATAERTARSVQSILGGSRSAARRLGLGQVFQVQLEGAFGTLSIAPGEQDAGAILCSGPLGRAREEALLGMAGLNAATAGEGALP